MASTVHYLINNTDDTLRFVITPRQYDGPGGVSRHTDLYLYGNAAPNWGEHFNENFFRLLENFAVAESNPDDQESGDPYTDDVPTPKTEEDLGFPDGAGYGVNFPIIGQLWYNKSRHTLHIRTENGWNPANSVLVAEDTGDGPDERDTLIPNPRKGELVYINTSGELQVFDGSDWVSATGSTGDFVERDGDTMTGALILHAHPTSGSPALQAATKQYVLDHTGASDHGALTGLADDDHTNYIHRSIARSSMTANLTMGTGARVYITGTLTPAVPNELATKQYVDDIAGSAGTILLASGSAVHGTVVPFPSGYNSSNCFMIVTVKQMGQVDGGSAIDYIECTSTTGGSGFTITCRNSRESNPNLFSATANYWILASGGSVIPPNPGGALVTEYDITYSIGGNSPHTGIIYKSDGTTWKTRASSTITYTEVALADWLLSGSASDYQIYCTLLSGGPLTGTTGSWINLTTSPNWRVNKSTPPTVGPIATATILISIREISSGYIVSSGTISLTQEGLV